MATDNFRAVETSCEGLGRPFCSEGFLGGPVGGFPGGTLSLAFFGGLLTFFHGSLAFFGGSLAFFGGSLVFFCDRLYSCFNLLFLVWN